MAWRDDAAKVSLETGMSATGHDSFYASSIMSPTLYVVRETIKKQPPIAVLNPTRSSKQLKPSGLSKGFITRSAPVLGLDNSSLRFLAADVEAADSFAVKVPKLQDGCSIRKLTRAEVRQRSKNAVSWFREVKNINRQARSPEEVQSAMAEVRRRKELELISPKEVKPLPARKSLAVQLPPDVEPQLETHPSATESSNGQQRQQQRPAAAGISSSPQHPPTEASNSNQQENQKAAAPKAKSFAERMGYGVKTPAAARAVVQLAPAAAKPVKRGNMYGVSVGDGSLLERIRARRENAK